MVKALVCYYSKTGNTEKMAEKIATELRDQGIATELSRVEKTSVDVLPEYDAIVLGSPVYYGSMAWPMKKFLDESVKYHRKLQGKVGAAFTSSMRIGGGNETALLDILHGLLIHGMVVQGVADSDHYGPVALGKPEKTALKACTAHARSIADLAKKLFD